MHTAVTGHCRYKKDKDGYYRLLAVRYESMDMKEQLISGLAPLCVSEDGSSGDSAPFESSLVFNLQDSTTDDTAVPMSNLELLGNVAYAMSQPDGTDVCTDAGDFALADGQMPGSHVIYVVPTDDDGTPQSFATALQPTVKHLSVEDGENVENDSSRSITDITNTSCLYYGSLPDACELPCGVGRRPTQYGMCSGDYNDNVTSSRIEDELAECDSDSAVLNVVTTSDCSFIHGVGPSLESFSLSLLTDAVTS